MSINELPATLPFKLILGYCDLKSLSHLLELKKEFPPVYYDYLRSEWKKRPWKHIHSHLRRMEGHLTPA